MLYYVKHKFIDSENTISLCSNSYPLGRTHHLGKVVDMCKQERHDDGSEVGKKLISVIGHRVMARATRISLIHNKWRS